MYGVGFNQIVFTLCQITTPESICCLIVCILFHPLRHLCEKKLKRRLTLKRKFSFIYLNDEMASLTGDT